MSNKEAGYNYLPTGFTGTYTPTLSGDNSFFPIASSDKGVSKLLEDGELG